MNARQIDISLVPERVGRWLAAIFALLLLAHGGGLVMTYGLDHDYVFGLVPLFNIGLEGNVPTFFASSLFATGGMLFVLLWRVGDRDEPGRGLWLLLGAVFLFLAVDEFAVIHELLINPVREGLDTGGLLYFAWIIPYCIAVLALAVWVAPKLWRLGPRFRLLFGMSAGAFLTGAVGVEMLGGRHLEENDGNVDLAYRLFQTVEECLEFTGLILLVYTQLALLRERAAAISLNLSFDSQAAAQTASLDLTRGTPSPDFAAKTSTR